MRSKKTVCLNFLMDELVKGIKQSVQWFAVVNIFLRIISGIIRQYNRHSWEFVMKAQLNGAKSTRLWNLRPIIVLKDNRFLAVK